MDERHRPAPVGAEAARRPTTVAVLLATVAVVVAGLLGLDARATHGAATSADEPYYLLTARSLASDGDLDLRDELAAEAFRPYHEVPLDEQTTPVRADGRRVAPHDPLLPLLLAPAMALPEDVAWRAAKATLVGLAAVLTALTTWVAVRRLNLAPRRAALVVGGLGASLPLSVYATQVYPELPAALAVMVVVALATSPRLEPMRTGPRAPGRPAWPLLGGMALAIVALPWLSVKYVPVAAVLAVGVGLRAWRAGLRRPVVAVGAVLGAAGVAYLAAHQAWYGGWTVYAAGDHFVDAGELSVVGTQVDVVGRSRRLVGLLVDRDYGIAAWSPAWLLAPAAVTVLAVGGRARRGDRLVRPGADRDLAWLLLAPLAAGWATATWVALTMHGWWVPGRQVVVVLPLAVLALAAWVARWSVPAVAGLAVLLAAGVVNTAVALREAATGGPVLIVDLADSAAPFRRLLAPLLPDGRVGGTTDDLGLLAWAIVLAATCVLAARSRAGSTPRVPPPYLARERETRAGRRGTAGAPGTPVDDLAAGPRDVAVSPRAGSTLRVPPPYLARERETRAGRGGTTRAPGTAGDAPPGVAP